MNNMYIGHNPLPYASAISHFISSCSEMVNQYSICLITVIDSGACKKWVPRSVNISDVAGEFIASDYGILTTGRGIVQLPKINVLNGFDEIWFSLGSHNFSVPNGLRITSDHHVTDLVDTVSSTEEIGIWMSDNQIVLGVGDGIGLNYITKDERIKAMLDSLQ